MISHSWRFSIFNSTLSILLELDIRDVAARVGRVALDDPEAFFRIISLRFSCTMGSDVHPVVRAVLLIGELKEIICELGAAIIYNAAFAGGAAKHSRLAQQHQLEIAIDDIRALLGRSSPASGVLPGS